MNAQQMSAAQCEAPSCLVIAGAGTGKTTTLIGRVKYLVSNGVDPASILLISLTNNTVTDLRRALDREFWEGFPASVMTIHALGNRIVGGRPCIGRQRNDIISRAADSVVRSDRCYAEGLLAWVDGMRSSGHGDMCLNGESIPNRGLRMIADALFRHRVRFVYERPTYSDKGYVQAHIDIEGLGLRLEPDHPLVKEAAKEPVNAYHLVRGILPRAEPMDVRDFASTILEAWGDRIPDSLGSMISRCKCARTSVTELRANLGRIEGPRRFQVERRLDVLDRVWDMYSLECVEKGLTDFDDMVIQAEVLVRGGHVPYFAFDHVLVDEYQDASPILVDLIRSLRRIWGFDLFCTGDDWQSIYSFTGGDIWQTYDFDEVWGEWGEVSTIRIEQTYRHPQQIADMAGRFIMANPLQLKKQISAPVADRFPVQLLPIESDRDIPRMVANRLDFIDPDDSVLVIGRTRSDVYALGGRSGMFTFTNAGSSGSVLVTYSRKSPDTEAFEPVRNIRYMTAHSAKGLEADWVFLLADRERGGFPSMVSDPMDALFDIRDEGMDLAEERRVFYVAMTRAKKGLFMVNLMEEGYALSSKGAFMTEVIDANIRQFTHSSPFCPECVGPMRIVGSVNGFFYGCCTYPGCKGTRPIDGRPFRCTCNVHRWIPDTLHWCTRAIVPFGTSIPAPTGRGGQIRWTRSRPVETTQRYPKFVQPLTMGTPYTITSDTMAGKDISDMSFDEFFGRGGSSKREHATKPVVEDATKASEGPKVDGSGFSRGRPKINLRSGQISLYIPKYEAGKGAKYEVSVEQGGRTVELGRLKSSPLDSDVSSLPTEFDLIANGISPLVEFVVSIDGKAVYEMYSHSHMLFNTDGMPLSRAEDTTVVLYPVGKYLWLTDAKVAATYDIGDLRVDTVEVARGGFVKVRDRPQKAVAADVPQKVVPEESKVIVRPKASITMPAAEPYVSVKDGKTLLHLYAGAPKVSIETKDADVTLCSVVIETGAGTEEFPLEVFDGTQLSDVSGRVVLSVHLDGKALASERFFVIPGFTCSYSAKGDIPEGPEVVFTIDGDIHTVDIYSGSLEGPYPFEGGELTLDCHIPVVTYDIGAGEVPFTEAEVDLDDLPASIVVNVRGATKRSVFLGGSGKKVNLTPDWDEGPIRLDTEPIRSAVFESHNRSAMLYITVNSCPVRRFLTVVNEVSMSVTYDGTDLVAEIGGSGEHVCRVFNLDRSVEVTQLVQGTNRVPVGPGAVSAEVAEVRAGKEIAMETCVIRELPFLVKDEMDDIWFYVSKDKRLPLPDGLITKDAAEIRKWHSQIIRMNPELRTVSPEKTVKAFTDFRSA